MNRFNVDQMLDEMSPHQFDEWIAFHEIEGWGDEHRQTANVMATIFNSQGGKKGGKPFSADDFLPKPVRHVDPREEQEHQLNQWKMFIARCKARGKQ